MAWYDGKIEKLRDLWENHFEINAETIGERFGVSKNAVIGVARRQGFKPRKETKQEETKNNQMNTEITNYCRYPIGHFGEKDFHFCGALIEKESYCLIHYQRTHVLHKQQE